MSALATLQQNLIADTVLKLLSSEGYLMLDDEACDNQKLAVSLCCISQIDPTTN